MGSEPFDLNNIKFKYDSDYQSVTISHDIETNPVITYQTGSSIFSFQFVKTPKITFPELMIPLQQSCLRWWIFQTELQQSLSIDDIKHSTKLNKVY